MQSQLFPNIRLRGSKPRGSHANRKFISVLLVAVLCFGPLAAKVRARISDPPDADYFVIRAGADGNTYCLEATAAERLELEKIKPKGLRQINHLEMNATAAIQPATTVQHLTIILNATAHLDANPDAKAAFIRAAATWESVVTSPVTIFIDADFGPDDFGTPWESGVLGATVSPSQPNVAYSTVRNNLIAGANTPAKTLVYNSLPSPSVPTDLGTANNVSVSNSIARAIGLLNPTALSTDQAPQIGFNSTVSFDFDSTNGIAFDQFDFEAIVTHEIGHALGFTSRSGSGSTTPAMWDLYRFRSGTTNATFPTAIRIMTIGGPVGNDLQFYFTPGDTELSLSTGGPNGVTTNGGDGNQSSHWKQASKNGGVFIGIMDPRIQMGQHRAMTSNDVNAIGIFGFNSNPILQPAPPPNDNFSAAQGISGCSGSISGTNLAATRETGEPNHSPDDGGGSRSVWYRWQSPSTGNVTITTAGSDFDTVLGVYSGTAVDSLTPLGKSDDISATDKTSSVTFAATAGTIYRIAVDGYNNSGSGGDTGSITLNWSAANCSVVVQLTASNFSIGEGGTTLSVGVTRTGNTGGSSSVNYATSDAAGAALCNVVNGNASSRCDYLTTSGTLNFAAGETAKTINVPVVDDVYAEGPETFTLTLSNAVGATLGAPSTATLTINDNEAVNGTNPIDTASFFVRQHYVDFLNREPDAGGLSFWTNQITSCGADTNCVAVKRVNVSAAFFLSIEFQETGYLVYRFYKSGFGNLPGAPVPVRFTDFLRDTQQIGQGVVVGVGAWEAQLEANKQAYALAFVQRGDFQAAFPNTMTAQQFVNQLDGNAGGVLSAAEKTTLVGVLGATPSDLLKRASVLRSVAEDATLHDAEFNKAFVLMQYFGYLRRNPNDTPDTDFGGLNFWLGKLNQFGGNFVDAEMVKSFILSGEYRQRFGP